MADIKVNDRVFVLTKSGRGVREVEVLDVDRLYGRFLKGKGERLTAMKRADVRQDKTAAVAEARKACKDTIKRHEDLLADARTDLKALEDEFGPEPEDTPATA
jgi:hypothetical protein